MGSSSLRESLSDVMVSYRLSVITPIVGYIGMFRRSILFLYLFHTFFFYLEGMLINIKLQWPALFQTLVFSADHPRKLLLLINGCILLKLKSNRSTSLSVGSVAVDSLIVNQFVIHLPILNETILPDTFSDTHRSSRSSNPFTQDP